MAYKDKERQKFIVRRWYLEHREEHIERAKQRRLKTAAWLKEYKLTLFCTKCGMSFKEHPECCDFHHLENKKEHVGNCRTLNKTKKEINKCLPICANCHRILHS